MAGACLSRSVVSRNAHILLAQNSSRACTFALDYLRNDGIEKSFSWRHVLSIIHQGLWQSEVRQPGTGTIEEQRSAFDDCSDVMVVIIASNHPIQRSTFSLLPPALHHFHLV